MDAGRGERALISHARNAAGKLPTINISRKKKLFFAAEEPELRAPGLLQADLAGPADPEGAPGGGAQERQDQHGRGERNKDKKYISGKGGGWVNACHTHNETAKRNLWSRGVSASVGRMILYPK